MSVHPQRPARSPKGNQAHTQLLAAARIRADYVFNPNISHFSPVIKTPPPSKTRRTSVAASRSVSSSAIDDFEELISEFADDHLVQGEVDTDIAEDELLQELSQMINS